jgi:hypothetical protein
LVNGEYNGIMPEEQDLEEYLAEIRNKLKQYNIWDDTWMLPEERDDAQRQELSSAED